MIWLDAQLPPSIAPWIESAFGTDALAVRDLGLRQAKDTTIFRAARSAGAVVMTKDADFVELLRRLGSPPKVLWLTCGNTSKAKLRDILRKHLPDALARLDAGEDLVEIDDVR